MNALKDELDLLRAEARRRLQVAYGTIVSPWRPFALQGWSGHPCAIEGRNRLCIRRLYHIASAKSYLCWVCGSLAPSRRSNALLTMTRMYPRPSPPSRGPPLQALSTSHVFSGKAGDLVVRMTATAKAFAIPRAASLDRLTDMGDK